MSPEFLTWLSAYVIIIICEMGDKTQLAVLLITCNNPRRRWYIFAASSLALTLCVLVEVTVGLTLARYIGPALINKLAGGLFLFMGVIILAKHFGFPGRLAAMIRRQNDIKDTEARAPSPEELPAPWPEDCPWAEDWPVRVDWFRPPPD
ncbi:MAG: TMEM165/GDT1 family protein [Syntrophomonadaceae bacterium]|nr:TMEM165/GDT1 family protein [Syntrophomonadaceae bacterium]